MESYLTLAPTSLKEVGVFCFYYRSSKGPQKFLLLVSSTYSIATSKVLVESVRKLFVVLGNGSDQMDYKKLSDTRKVLHPLNLCEIMYHRKSSSSYVNNFVEG